ncbi:MAG: PAS domain-containing protein, partial [Desulfuromonadales bacterium]|nr:PAS domain-containing protein [Desulfuromonadales bacterium]
MPSSLTNSRYPITAARRIALIYLALSLLWIYFGDRLLLSLVDDPVHLTRWQSWKGWLFVVGSALLIDLLVRRALGALQRSEARLAEERSRLQLFIAHAPAALAMFDRQMCYLAVSRRWLDEFGLAGRELLGRSHYEIFPEIGENWRAAHRRGLAGEVVGSEEDRFE